MKMTESYQKCSRGVWDITVPGITFNKDGASNYSKIHDEMVKAYPRGIKGLQEWKRIVEKIKRKGKNKRYDCIIGISGGTDSSFLLHIAKEYSLRPLAVNLDNGWSSDISVRNIKKVTTKLGIDLETYVIDYEEVKDVLRSYMKASLPWVDSPTDLAIKAILYKIANRERIKYMLIGADFRSEGKQPIEWTHGDARQLKYIVKKFGSLKLKTFPYLTLKNLIYYSYIKKIKMLRPYFYLDYQKKGAQKLLKETYGWEYYGGHHHENIFTKFIISYWLPKKFNIDKRKITLSAQILSGEITRAEALEQLKHPPYDAEQMERDREYIIKKLDLTEREFNEIWLKPNKSFRDYPSYYPIISKFIKIIKPFLKYIYSVKLPMLFEIEGRGKNNL